MIARDDGILPVQPVPGNRPAGSPPGAETQAGVAPPTSARQQEPTSARQQEGESREGAELARALLRPEIRGELPGLLQAHESRLSFEMDESSGKMVVCIKDRDTGQLLRQIPPEVMLKIARSIDQYLGLLVDRHS